MLDLSKIKWEMSHNEKYAVKWFNDHGFDGEVKQYLSKTKFTLTKDGKTDTFELPTTADVEIKSYMQQYEKSWKLHCEINQLRRQLANK